MQTARDHVWNNCPKANGRSRCNDWLGCSICDGELVECQVCGAIDGVMLPTCPGVRLPPHVIREMEGPQYIRRDRKRKSILASIFGWWGAK